MKKVVAALLSMAIAGCAPSSRIYKPAEWEAPLLKAASRNLFPSDLKGDPEKHKGKLIHLIGIGKSVSRNEHSPNTLDLVADQKYWDYVEDFSIQKEVMFLSPRGEGEFIYRYRQDTPISQKQEEDLRKRTARGDLLMVYGHFVGLEEGRPVLEGRDMKVIHEDYYATTILSYTVKRGEDGTVMVDEMGFPLIAEVRRLKVPRRGKND